jgi:cytochrome c oxidase subunit 2
MMRLRESWRRRAPGWHRRAPLVALAVPLQAAASRQSALDPQGPAAGDIAQLWWVMLAGAIAIFVVVMGLLLYGLLAKRTRPGAPTRALIVGGGVVFPVVVLSALLVYTVALGARLGAGPPPDALVVDVTGHMWWWDVRYADENGRPALTTANELRIPVGRPVHLRIRSNDVIHSFWVPNLAGKIDMIPGRVNAITLRADAPGVFRGQCAEFCGLQHTLMALHVVAEEAQAWEAWFGRSRTAAARVTATGSEAGRKVFVEAGCGSCHALRGVSDPPPGLAPDLTHVGSRPSLGAGLLPNSVGTIAAWIAGSQSIKPGNAMPSFDALTGAELTAVAEFLAAQE